MAMLFKKQTLVTHLLNDFKKFIELSKFPDPNPGKRHYRNNDKFHDPLKHTVLMERRINKTHNHQSAYNMNPTQNYSDFLSGQSPLRS